MTPVLKDHEIADAMDDYLSLLAKLESIPDDDQGPEVDRLMDEMETIVSGLTGRGFDQFKSKLAAMGRGYYGARMQL